MFTYDMKYVYLFSGIATNVIRFFSFGFQMFFICYLFERVQNKELGYVTVFVILWQNTNQIDFTYESY